MVYLCESVCFSFINVHTTCQCTCIYWELGQYILSQWNHAQPCGQWRHSITWYINYQVRFFNLTLSAGVVSVCVSSCVCYHWAFLSGSICSRVHVVKWSLWGIYRTMPKDFSKFSFLPLFLGGKQSKNGPKMTFLH